eukprot:CAMPEP_0173111728 /NCGR_PEP_ID=MMETSP1102-20130122/45408_1 /TAXON_ID=49646 /ORGANISM="Geminigera sp., Strain Caron Lab Isolate" /LENGTH=76 /DNA_ID=CAMNT_0014012289 /DNA_START=34 /DNA_END=261 /DNA_ORIENTATION=-
MNTRRMRMTKTTWWGVALVVLVACQANAHAQSEDTTLLRCNIDTLRDEFGAVTVDMSLDSHERCCGALRRFLKVAQ